MQDDIKELKTMVRAMINGQSAMKSELLTKIESVEKRLGSQIEEHRKETKQGFIDINNRADSIGKQLNILDEDAPTSDEFKSLVKRVDKLEHFQNFAAA